MARPNAPEYAKRRLELGLSGLDVWHLQIKLIGWGSGSLTGALEDEDKIGIPMDPVRVTGNYDATTADAVRRFQKAHEIPVTGVCDALTFRAIDREQADHPVFLDALKCPCAAGKNDLPTKCRCNKHPTVTVKCNGFGGGNFNNAYLLDGHATLSGEKLDLYYKREYAGMDKAVIWAVRALMHRAKVADIEVAAGYRCWFDNYQTTDDTRWKHRTSTFHLGKTIEIRHRGTCILKGDNPCPECSRIREVALSKCGFQLRWHELDRVSVAEGAKDSRPPATPFSVLVSTVRRKDKEDDDFVKTDADAAKPLYEDGKAGFYLPMELGEKAGFDPKRVPSADFFDDIETKAGGTFPLGANRLWHTGVHLHKAKGAEVRAITDGELIGCRVGEAEQAKDLGSRNFVLIRHKRKDKHYYSLYMHLDGQKADDPAALRWRKQLLARSVEHVEALVPSPIYKHVPEVLAPATPSMLVALGHNTGLAKGECVAVTGAEVDATTLDKTLPANTKARKLTTQSNDGKDQYVITKRASNDENMAKHKAAMAGLADKITNGVVIGLAEPISVSSGEILGKVADPPKDASLAFAGSFVHVETFSEENLLKDPDFLGFKVIDASDQDKVADRKEVLKALLKATPPDNKGLLEVEPPDSVLSEQDYLDLLDDPAIGRFRSVVLKTKCAWAVNWKAALRSSKSVGFLKDDARDALGDAYNLYAFWDDVKAAVDALLPASAIVHHYHPIVLLLAFANKPEG